jgi:uncharacterized protein YcbX
MGYSISSNLFLTADSRSLESSLSTVNSWLANANHDHVPMARFRPNIVVRGCAPFDEDAWYEIGVSPPRPDRRPTTKDQTITMYAVKPCSRCKLTTVIPDKGEFGGPEPLRTIQANHNGTFGQNLIHSKHSIGQFVTVGDEIIVQSKK